MTNKSVSCQDFIQILNNKIQNGEFYLTESALVKEFNTLRSANEHIQRCEVDNHTALLEAIYNNINMDKEGER